MDKLSRREKFFFALGDFHGGGAAMLLNVMYFKFLTDVMMIPAGISGTIVLVTKVWDAVIDPVIGVASDNTRTRWGRRRPAIFAGGFLIVAAFALLFMPVQGFAQVAKIAYITFSWMFSCTVSSYIAIAYSSLSGELSNDYNERNEANSLRLAISQISNLVCATVPLLLRDMLIPVLGEPNAYLAVALIFGVVFGVILILVAVNTKERVPIPAEKSSFSFKTFLLPLRIKSFRQMVCMYLFTFMSMDIVITLFQHFMQYVAHREGETSFVLGALIIAEILMIPLVYAATKRISKPTIFKLSVPLWILGAFCLGMYNESWSPVMIYVFAAITGLGVCGCVMMPWLMFPDIVDVGELALGSRISGSFSGIMSFMRQVSSAVGIAIVGWIMEWTGYNAALGTFGQPASAITGFRFLVIFSTLVFLGIALVAAFRLKLNEQRTLMVKKALACTRENQPLPEDLRRETDALWPLLVGGEREEI